MDNHTTIITDIGYDRLIFNTAPDKRVMYDYNEGLQYNCDASPEVCEAFERVMAFERVAGRELNKDGQRYHDGTSFNRNRTSIEEKFEGDISNMILL